MIFRVFSDTVFLMRKSNLTNWATKNCLNCPICLNVFKCYIMKNCIKFTEGSIKTFSAFMYLIRMQMDIAFQITDEIRDRCVVCLWTSE